MTSVSQNDCSVTKTNYTRCIQLVSQLEVEIVKRDSLVSKQEVTIYEIKQGFSKMHSDFMKTSITLESTRQDLRFEKKQHWLYLSGGFIFGFIVGATITK